MLLPNTTALKYWLESHETNRPIKISGRQNTRAARTPTRQSSQTTTLTTIMKV